MYILDYIYIDNESETIVHGLIEKRFYHYSTMSFPNRENDFKMN